MGWEGGDRVGKRDAGGPTQERDMGEQGGGGCEGGRAVGWEGRGAVGG